MTKPVTNCLLISDFNVKSLAGHLENSSSPPDCGVTQAPFDQVVQLLLQAEHEGWSPPLQSAVIWTRPGRVSPPFARVLAGAAAAENNAMGAAAAFCILLSKVAGRVP